VNEKLPVRIAVVSDALSARNGVGTYYLDLAEHLRDRVEAVEVFCPSLSDPPGHQAFTLPLPGDASQRIGVPNIWRLYRRLRALKPQVVIIPIPGPYGIIGLLLARLMGLSVCVAFHTDYERVVRVYWRKALAGPSGRGAEACR